MRRHNRKWDVATGARIRDGTPKTWSFPLIIFVSVVCFYVCVNALIVFFCCCFIRVCVSLSYLFFAHRLQMCVSMLFWVLISTIVVFFYILRVYLSLFCLFLGRVFFIWSFSSVVCMLVCCLSLFTSTVIVFFCFTSVFFSDTSYNYFLQQYIYVGMLLDVCMSKMTVCFC